MDSRTQPDPIDDILGRAMRRGAQVASAAVAAQQLLNHLRTTQNDLIAEPDELASSELRAQLRADRAAASRFWFPVLDPDWLRRADLASVIRAWGAAMPFADRTDLQYEPVAAITMQRCEERLQEIHPYAMRRYDFLRGEGRTPADSMLEAAPFFRHAPSPRALHRQRQDFPVDARDAAATTARPTPPSGRAAPSAAGRGDQPGRHGP